MKRCLKCLVKYEAEEIVYCELVIVQISNNHCKCENKEVPNNTIKKVLLKVVRRNTYSTGCPFTVSLVSCPAFFMILFCPDNGWWCCVLTLLLAFVIRRSYWHGPSLLIILYRHGQSLSVISYSLCTDSVLAQVTERCHMLCLYWQCPGTEKCQVLPGCDTQDQQCQEKTEVLQS